MERWLLEDVVPVYDEMKADPGLARPLAEVRERLRAKRSIARRGAVTRRVVLAPQAEADLESLYDYIADRSGAARAQR